MGDVSLGTCPQCGKVCAVSYGGGRFVKPCCNVRLPSAQYSPDPPEDRRQQELIGGLLEIATQHIDAGAYDEAKLTIKHAMEKNWER